ncbi:MAG: HIT domain-containing protein [Lentisphaerae bacterium]|nr:HIT domain-containing protein [Lentisphaerota bacterium]
MFCRIAAGAAAAAVVYEDDATLAFLDSMPMIKGHVLVIPKAHYTDLGEAPAAVLGAVMQTVQRVMRAQRGGLKADGVRLIQSNGAAAGQVVPHLHFHVIPRFDNDGAPRGWAHTEYADDAERDAVAERIRTGL